MPNFFINLLHVESVSVLGFFILFSRDDRHQFVDSHAFEVIYNFEHPILLLFACIALVKMLIYQFKNDGQLIHEVRIFWLTRQRKQKHFDWNNKKRSIEKGEEKMWKERTMRAEEGIN